MAADSSNASTTITLNMTTTFDDKPVKNIAKWINTMIIILGLITNTLILVILSRRKIGSQTTRIILIFLAVTDLAVMFVEFFIHYVPYYWQWFQVFSSDISCGIAFMIQGAAITTSSWYLMLMTMERFTVVWFPMKAKIICTQKKILVSCIVIPILCLAAYSFFLIDIESFQMDDSNYINCRPSNETRETTRLEFNNKLKIWITLYFFIPATTIVVLNTGIVIRLAKAHKLQQKMSMKNSLKNARQNSVKSKVNRQSSGGGGGKQTAARQASHSSAGSSIKKATTLVIAASITFVVLMIPRGVLTTITLNADWKYDTEEELIWDAVAYQLQYLNHAINFFLYVLANNSFRREIKNLFRCKTTSPNRQHTYRRAASCADTDATQTSYVRSPPHSPDANDHLPLYHKHSMHSSSIEE